MKLFYIGILILGLSLSGCDASNGDTVLLRVQNATSVHFTEVHIQFLGSPETYRTVQAGAFSDYRPFDTAYRYGLVEVTTVDTTYRLQPIDYVGETPLGAGRYTFRLSLSNEQMGLELIRE
jgi:hypothetical protein